MTIEIKKKIVGYEVLDNKTEVAEETKQQKTKEETAVKDSADKEPAKAEIIHMLMGRKSPVK